MLNPKDTEAISKTRIAQYQTQITISFTLNIKREMTHGELYAHLDGECPMEVKDPSLFEVSSECWDIHLKDGVPIETKSKI